MPDVGCTAYPALVRVDERWLAERTRVWTELCNNQNVDIRCCHHAGCGASPTHALTQAMTGELRTLVSQNQASIRTSAWMRVPRFCKAHAELEIEEGRATIRIKDPCIVCAVVEAAQDAPLCKGCTNMLGTGKPAYEPSMTKALRALSLALPGVTGVQHNVKVLQGRDESGTHTSSRALLEHDVYAILGEVRHRCLRRA